MTLITSDGIQKSLKAACADLRAAVKKAIQDHGQDATLVAMHTMLAEYASAQLSPEIAYRDSKELGDRVFGLVVGKTLA